MNGARLPVSNDTAHDQFAPSVALNDSGAAVFAWESAHNGSGSDDVYAQLYNAGTKVNGEFRVNTTTAGVQDAPAAAITADGRFIIAWQSNPQDGSGYGVYAQRYRADGTRKGTEFRANRTIANDQDSPSVGIDSSGSFFIAWESNQQDGSGYGIYGDRFMFNNRPASQNQFVTLDEDTQVTVTLTASDTDGDTLTYSHTNPAHGTVTGTGKTLTYKPNANYNGRDSFTYIVNDGTANSSPGEIVFEVQGINDAPVAQNQTVMTTPNKARYITLTATDVDSGAFTFSLASQPSKGTLTPTNSVFLYTPNADFTGTDSFTFKAKDKEQPPLESNNVGTVTINVQ